MKECRRRLGVEADLLVVAIRLHYPADLLNCKSSTRVGRAGAFKLKLSIETKSEPLVCFVDGTDAVPLLAQCSEQIE